MIRNLAMILVLAAVMVEIPAQATVPEAQKSLHKVTLTVGNLTCAMCKYTVENALKKVNGVQSAQVDMEKNIAVVVFDPAKTDVEKLVEAVTNAGYPATVKQ